MYGSNFSSPLIEPASRKQLRSLCLECLSRDCVHQQERPASLSRQERNVVRLLGLGRSNKEIAVLLHIAESTVKVYNNLLFRKLGLASRLEVALWGLKHADLIP